MAYFPCAPKPRFKKIRTDLTTRLLDAPYICYAGSAVTLNGEVHILGGGGTSGGAASTRRQHYKWDGTKWIEVSTLPIDLYYGSAIVYNGEIHIFMNQNHYKWNGSTWTSVNTLPYSITESSVVVYKGEIYLIGGSSSGAGSKFYKFDEFTYTWTALRTIPYSFKGSMATVFQDSIYILGYNSNDYWCKWNGSTWTYGYGTDNITGMYHFTDTNDGFLTVMDDTLWLYYKDTRAYFDGSKWVWMTRRVPTSSGASWSDTKYHPNKIHLSCIAVDDEGVHIICFQNSSSVWEPTHVVENVNIYIPM